MSELTGVILSAGKGSRIDPFNAQYPKPLLPIGNVPILGHHIAMMRTLGIRRVVIVVGHLMERIIAHFGRGDAFGVEITYVEQDRILGIAHAVGQAERYVEGDFLLCLGDIHYRSTRVHELVDIFRERRLDGVLAVKRETDPKIVQKNFTVETGAEGLVTRVIEKPRKPKNLLKGCGIYVFSEAIFDCIRRTPRTALRDEYEITTSIQILLDDGGRVAAADVIDEDLNVTFPHDLLDGNVEHLRHAGMRNLIDPTAQLEAPERLNLCTVGAGARIAARDLTECVILPLAVVPEGPPLQRAIISRDVLLRC
jgi:dTDP-glucose pyrophosphorylase